MVSAPAAGTPVAMPVRAGFWSYSGQLALAVPAGLAAFAALAVAAVTAPDALPAAMPAPEQAATTHAAAARVVPRMIDPPDDECPE